MKIVVLDSTAVVPEGPGSPAWFSRYAVAHLESLGHDILIAGRFDANLCADADVVWTEWCNEDLVEAAASGVCKKLIARLRGYEVFGLLPQVEWQNVDHLCYESPFLQQLAEEAVPGLRGFKTSILPGGVDVANIPYRERKHGPVVALVARAVADKGFQLAFEWARQRPDIQLHVAAALGRSNPRLVRYLEHVKPSNVTIYPGVDTVKWLDEIDANYLLSASHWESLGYTIAEAMAMGIKPLIHATPGAAENWPPKYEHWTSLADLNFKMSNYMIAYASRAYRNFVENHLDAAKLSAAFADLVLSPPVQVSAPRKQQNSGVVIASIDNAIVEKRLSLADRLLTEFRQRTQHLGPADDHRAGLAFKLAVHYFEAEKLDEARVWALRSLGDIVNPEVMCLLGEIADAQDDRENAVRWYEASMVVGEVPSLYRSNLTEGAFERLNELDEALEPKLVPGPKPSSYLIVVAVRNAEKYIGRCLESIKAQTRPFLCIVIDDDSTDGTGEIVDAFTSDKRFRCIVGHHPRYYSLFNIVHAVPLGQPDDVVVIVDGDDELKPDALETFDEAYAKGAWMTYGSFVSTSGRRNWMAPYPQRVLRDGHVRDWPWRVSHPKTFRKKLFDKIQLEDFQHEGKWFTTAGDVALMLPMLEMAAERAIYIQDVLYTYNDENVLGDHRVDPDGQVRVRDLIYLKPKYKRLEEL